MTVSRTVIRRNWAAMMLTALALAGCSGLPSSPSDLMPDWKFNPHFPSFSNATGDTGFTVFKGAAEAPVKRTVTPADLVDAQGRCANAPAEGAATGHIALTMTECEVVAANGPPTQVTIGADAAGDRQTVMTYDKGDHPGVYTFVSGRLKVMEELPTAAKPELHKRVAKKPPAKKPAARKSSPKVQSRPAAVTVQ